MKQATPNGVVGQLTVTVGKSLAIDSPLAIKRLAFANGTMVDAQAIGPKEILLNGKAPGETSLIIWQEDGTRLIYDLTVRVSPQRLNAVRQQIARDYPDADINVTFDNDTAFVRGTVKDITDADRIMAIVGTLRVQGRQSAQGGSSPSGAAGPAQGQISQCGPQRQQPTGREFRLQRF